MIGKRERTLIKVTKQELEAFKDITKEALLDTPLDILNEYEEYIMEAEVWQLCEERQSGPAKGSRRVGAANMLFANSLVLEYFDSKRFGQNHEEKTDSAVQFFKHVLQLLVEENFLRKNPEVVRQMFTLIEGDNNDRHGNSRTINIDEG